MPLRKRFALLLSAVVVLVALGSTAAAVLLSRSDEARIHRDRELARVASAERLRGAYLSQAVATRAFLLTGDETHLIEYEAGRADQDRLTRALDAGHLTAEEAATLDRVTSSAGRWQTEAIEPLISMRRSSDVDAVAARYSAVAPRDLFTSIEDEVDALISQFTAGAAGSKVTADKARRDAASLGVGTMLLAVVIVASVSFAIRRWVTVPLAALGSSVRVVHGGDLTTPITASGPSEIAELGTEIEQLRRRVAVELETSLRSMEGLAQNAAVLMSVRSRLESAPELMPAGWSVAASLTPATGVVAGDCYDVGRIGASRLGIVVVDVAGHGAESAVVALRVKELLRAASRTYADLGEGVQWVNHQLDGLAPDMFVTAFVAIVDTATGSIDYVGAGHPPPLLCGADRVIELAPTGPIIGPFEAEWRTAHARIEVGQTLLVYTDGLTEVREQDRTEFGLERLSDLVCGEFDDAEVVIKRCLDETAAFSTIRGQDDVTLVAVCRSSSRLSAGPNG